MEVFIPIPMRRTTVTARCELRAPFRCKSCGFEAVAKVVATGSASTHALPIIAPNASEHERERARWNAQAEGSEQLALVPCPKCGKRDPVIEAQFNFKTHVLRAIVAVLCTALVVGLWLANPENPVVAIVCAIPGLLVVFLVGFLRNLLAETPKDRVTFLSAEDIAAEEAAEARKAARAERAAQKHAQEREAKTKRRGRKRTAPDERTQ
jgi:predicted RNA-binding Zn-ribbon protein involved in translation (DUF1610 family)